MSIEIANTPECSICYEELKTNNLCVTSCNHDFCFNCIVQFINSANKNNYSICCPVCRTDIIINQNNEDDMAHGEPDNDDYSISSNDLTIEDNFDLQEDYMPSIESIQNELEQRNYNMKDILSLLLCRFSKTDPKYSKEYINKLYNDFEEIRDELNNQHNEQILMTDNDNSI
jgi:uncharacterized protein YbaR (Trm112 family)